MHALVQQRLMIVLPVLCAVMASCAAPDSPEPADERSRPVGRSLIASVRGNGRGRA